MHDMTSFERQLAMEIGLMAGPSRSIDAMAMVRSLASTSDRWRFQPVFGAARFAIAGAIVLLFGTLLLAAVMSQQADQESRPALGASPTPSPHLPTPRNLLPGVDLVTEDVEPGVYRVVSDGVRDLARERPFYDFADYDFHIKAGLDGSVWLLGPDGSSRARRNAITPYPEQADFFRLGGPSTYRLDDMSGPTTFGTVEVDLDGQLWMLPYGAGLWRISGSECPGCRDWEERESGDPVAFAMRSDGTAFAFSDSMGASLLSQRRGETWSSVLADTGATRTDAAQLWAPDVGEPWLYLPNDGAPNNDVEGNLFRFDGSAWVKVGRPDMPGVLDKIRQIDVGADGTPWARLVMCSDGGCGADARVLARFGQSGWTLFGPSDGVPELANIEFPGQFEVAPDGSVWTSSIAGVDETEHRCAGLHHFDGATWTRYLDGICVYAMDVARDGTVWLRGGAFDLTAGPFGSGAGPVELYVIRPEIAAD